tara:strand:- start:353 stop:487 length:135 start_codon:yes stop_codon:yes gene_type:complete
MLNLDANQSLKFRNFHAHDTTICAVMNATRNTKKYIDMIRSRNI